MDCPLLLLPGELRNIICKYALTEDAEKLYYRKDVRGVGWFCLPEHRISALESTTTAIDSSDNVANLETPRYNLRSHKRRKTVNDIGLLSIMVNGHTVANQLQFVCRQLRAETRTLGLRHNHLYFNENIDHLPEFLASIAACKNLHIPKIVQSVAHHYTTFELMILYVIEVLAKYLDKPHIETPINVHLPISLRDAKWFLLGAIVIKRLFRGDTSLSRRLINNLDVQTPLNRLANGHRAEFIDPLLPPSLRVFPLDEQIDEVAIRKQCQESVNIRPMGLMLPGGLDDIVAIANEWYKHGY